MRFEVKEVDKYIVLEIYLDRPITPQDIKNLRQLPKIQGKPLIISGRGPIWLYCYLVHYYCHLVPYIATYDPKLNGAVVVVSHDPSVSPGDIIPLQL